MIEFCNHTYSRSMNQVYPRKCLNCGQTEPSRELPKQEKGIFDKFIVTRVDGTHAFGKKHHNCDYFVLDMTHDKFALAAIRAYANACQKEYPVLAKDILEKYGDPESIELDIEDSEGTHYISVENLLPEPYLSVLVWEQYSNDPFVGYIDDSGKWNVSHEHVDAAGGWEGAIVVDYIQWPITHWAYLPPNPKV